MSLTGLASMIQASKRSFVRCVQWCSDECGYFSGGSHNLVKDKMKTITRPRWQQCHGKIRYMDKHQAMRKIGRIKQNTPINGVMTLYKCEHCGKWHTGHAIGKNYKIGIKETHP